MALNDPRFLKVAQFTNKQHHSQNATTDPKNVTLASGFAVCIIGASSGIGEHVAYSYAQAGASHICIASRTINDLQIVCQNIQSTNSKCQVTTSKCDVSDISSVKMFASAVDDACPNGLDVVVTVPASSPPFTPNILHDDPSEAQEAFQTNSVGIFSVGKFFIPLLLRKNDGAKAFIAVASQGSCLMKGFAAQMAYNTSKMAQMRLIEYMAEQFRDQNLLCLNIHPGSVLTKLAKKNCPEEFQHLLVDDKGLCGGVCVWATKQSRELAWLSGRFLSSNWDMDELLDKKGDIVEKDMLKFAMITE